MLHAPRILVIWAHALHQQGVGFKPRAEKFTGVLTALMAKLEKDKVNGFA